MQYSDLAQSNNRYQPSMANVFSKLIDAIFGPAGEPEPPLTPEEQAGIERFIFEIFAQHKAKAWTPVGTIAFSPRLRRRSGNAHLMDRGMSYMLAQGLVETHNVRNLVLTDAGYARMQSLGIKAPEEQ
jgi:hypothetical protein